MLTGVLDIYDLILSPIYLLFIFFIAKNYQFKKIKKNPQFKYFTIGLFAKIFGGICVCLIYVFYYKGGGDTIGYYDDTITMLRLADKNPSVFTSIMFGNTSLENYSFFDSQTGFSYYYLDGYSFFVVRLSVFITLLGSKSYICTTILISTITYSGIWSLYQLLYKQFNEIKSQVAFSVLFVPSVFFWGSGMLKDSYTLAALCWFIVGVYSILILKKKFIFSILVMVISFFIMLKIKPYIFYSSFAGALIMYGHYFLKGSKNAMLKYTVFPIAAVLLIIGGSSLMFKIGSTSGEYSSLDKMFVKASASQYDLKQAYYGGNRFDIGSFDPTLSGVLSKAPVAMTAGLFRPFLWEARNPVMLVSAIENSVLLFLFFSVILLCIVASIKTSVRRMLKIAFDNSLIIFSLVFSFTFAFAVGLSTANFGALVRYKIPLIPFFLASLFYIIYRFNQEDAEKAIAQKEKH